ncbi:MAG: 23S rRNA (uracil(1939)-C(5))-methyltransferase RlmD [Ignavibacteria bacterium]|nr:23S rRNA (uracil(1939)-C(5))-methyltransferase RlmD [Ignavibacteria bacterium]MBL0322908.1 23S rRNA (uracil(1939)-C(5))-methyltransferase RlmD [Ignavibacteria bacterium]
MRKQLPVQEIEITVDAIGFEGISIGRIDNLVHFVAGALPGERVRARVTGKKKKFIQAETIEVLVASPDRVEAPCPHFGTCGGCKWQHLAYAQQAQWKRQHVVDAFERLAHVPVGSIKSTLASPEPFHYRNKMEFSFGASSWLTREEIESGKEFDTQFALGLHVPGRFDKVRDVEHCLLQSTVANTILAHTHACADTNGIRAYHQRFHDGFARHLVIRTSAAMGTVMTILITTTPTEQAHADFIEAWMSLYPSLPEGSSMIHAVNDSWSPVAVGEIKRTLGPGYLDEVSHGITYRVSPFSFFQTNTQHLPALVEEAMQGAGITSADVVWDLYCGTGTLTLPAAQRAKHVVGAELSAGSIADARANAERNGITNVEFHTVDLHVPSALDVLRGFPTPDVILIDPPRNGMHEQVVRHLMAVGAPRILYVSCNPATMARDCAILHEMYDVEVITPVDMFPQTFHVEAVGVLVKR